jgi:hypothetical protein
MTQLTIIQASKITKKSVVTLYRHIKEGKLSCNTNKDGVKMIDLSELSRVYDLNQLPVSNNELNQMKQLETPNVTELNKEIMNLHEIIKIKEMLLHEKDKRIELLTYSTPKNQNKVIWIYVVLAIIITVLAVNLAWFMPNLKVNL